MIVEGQLLENILIFGRLLHNNGLDVNPYLMVTLLRALDFVDISNKKDFYHACRCTLAHREGDLALFDEIFEKFWRYPRGRGIPLNLPRSTRQARANSFPIDHSETKVQEQSTDPAKETSPGEILITKTYSSREILRQKDFSDLNPEEVSEVKDLIREMVQRTIRRKSRRYKYNGRTRVDLRRTLRRSVQYGGNILEWTRLEPKWKPRPLIVLADVSGSMESYTEMLLFFLIALSGSLKHVEAFLFSTRLTRITTQLRANNVEKGLNEISQTVPDWAGGTRIGEAIRAFNYKWARRVLSNGAVIMLISDGWDRGEPYLLSREMARLQRSCHQLIWLNPLLGIPEYEPLTQGIQAALPFIDDHLPVHNLASLEDLALHLRDIPPWRSIRPQRHLHLLPSQIT